MVAESSGGTPHDTEAAAPPEAEPREAPWRSELYRDTWPGLDATLLGVDASGKQAYLKLVSTRSERYAIDTIDLVHGRRVTRWEAGPEQARKLARYDGRFASLTGSPREDLGHLATMMAGWSGRAQRIGSAWPVADASADGKLLALVAEPARRRRGDWLFLYDTQRERRFRIGRRTTASYDAKFSPAGDFVSWRGCIGRRPCRYHLYVSSVDDALAGRSAARLPVRDPRGPVWRADGSGLLALGTDKRGRRCITETTPPRRRPWRRAQTRALVCDAALSDFVLAPDAASLVLVRRSDAGATIRRHTDEGIGPDVRVERVSDVTVSNRGVVLGDHPPRPDGPRHGWRAPAPLRAGRQHLRVRAHHPLAHRRPRPDAREELRRRLRPPRRARRTRLPRRPRLSQTRAKQAPAHTCAECVLTHPPGWKISIPLESCSNHFSSLRSTSVESEVTEVGLWVALVGGNPPGDLVTHPRELRAARRTTT